MQVAPVSSKRRSFDTSTTRCGLGKLARRSIEVLHENQRRDALKKNREIRKLGFQAERIRELTTEDLPVVVGGTGYGGGGPTRLRLVPVGIQYDAIRLVGVFGRIG
jgi:hypothetical protein